MNIAFNDIQLHILILLPGNFRSETFQLFRSMFATGCWIEGRRNQVLNLPVTSRLMTSLLDFLYTDELKVGFGDDPEFFCNLLVTADQFLIPRLIQVNITMLPT